jgi:hypothetical protein
VEKFTIKSKFDHGNTLYYYPYFTAAHKTGLKIHEITVEFHSEPMSNKTIIVTGASRGICCSNFPQKTT